MRKTLSLLVAGLVCAGVMSSAVAAEDHVKARRAIFKEYKKTFGAGMGKMMKGETPYNKDEFAAMATKMVDLSKQPWDHFPEGSNKGKTEAKPEIWSKPAEFKKEIDSHQAAIAKLATAAQTGDMAQIKPAFGAAQKTCKACHDTFIAV